MIFSDLPSPAEATNEHEACVEGFAQAGNRFPPRIKSGTGSFGIMLLMRARNAEVDGLGQRRLHF
jgi:hypothetical protein